MLQRGLLGKIQLPRPWFRSHVSGEDAHKIRATREHRSVMFTAESEALFAPTLFIKDDYPSVYEHRLENRPVCALLGMSDLELDAAMTLATAHRSLSKRSNRLPSA